MRSTTSRHLVTSLLLATIVIVAVNAFFAYQAVNHLLESEFWVQHTWQVIYQLERVIGDVKDAESSTRGYANTGNEEYLHFYDQARQQLPGEIDEFTRLVADNQDQMERVPLLREAVQQRLETLGTSVKLHREKNIAGYTELIRSGVGRAQMDHLRNLINDAEAEERRLLVLRTGATVADRQRTVFSLILASGIDFLLIVVMFRYFSRERSLRVESETANTKLALANAAIEASSAQIQELNRSLEERVAQRTAELATTNRELEAFSYSVSHDLRAPLRTIDGFSLALEEDYAEAVDETGRDYIRRVRTGVQRIGSLIDALLQLSRITRAEITREPVDITAVSEAIATELRDGGGEAQAVTFHIQPHLHAEVDAKLLRVALDNLIGNAVKFSSKTALPEVWVGWDAAEQAWFVRDNGAGFDMYYADKLFNAFNRLHGDKDFKGSGIGLATVARVVRRHHGRIWADSVVDHGATFWFTLG